MLQRMERENLVGKKLYEIGFKILYYLNDVVICEFSGDVLRSYLLFNSAHLKKILFVEYLVASLCVFVRRTYKRKVMLIFIN